MTPSIREQSQVTAAFSTNKRSANNEDMSLGDDENVIVAAAE